MAFPYKALSRCCLLIVLISGKPEESAAAETFQCSRKEALAYALENNRDLAVALVEVARAQAALRRSGRLENPELELSYANDDMGLDENESTFELAFTQRFPLTSRLRDEKRLRAHRVTLAVAEIAEQCRELAGHVDRAWVEWMAVSEVIDRQRRLLELNVQIVEVLNRLAATGQVSPLDVTQTRLTGRTLEQRVDTLAVEEKTRASELRQLMGIDPATELQSTETFVLPGSPPAMTMSFHDLLARRPDFVLALAKIDEANAAVVLERSKRWEDVALRLFVEQERSVDEPAGLETNRFLGIGLSVPLPLRQRNQEGIDNAMLDRLAAERTVEALRFRIRSEYERAWNRLDSAWSVAADASGEVLDLARQSFDQFQAAYQEGQASLLQVQRAQEQQLELERASAEAVANYHRAAAGLRLVTADYPALQSTAVSDKK